MTPNQSIEIELVNVSGSPLAVANVQMNIHFFTKGNYRYAFGLGFTGANGSLRASYDDIERRRKENAEFAIMDYNTRLDDCDPRVGIVVPSEQYLREAYDRVIRAFRKPPEWARNWPANVHLRVQNEETYVELRESITHVEIAATSK